MQVSQPVAKIHNAILINKTPNKLQASNIISQYDVLKNKHTFLQEKNNPNDM